MATETAAPPLRRVLSLGAGVQSSTLALMIACGELPPIEFAVFADTQAEPVGVYSWLSWLTKQVAELPQPFPIHQVTAGSLEAANLRVRTAANGNRYVKHSVPTFAVADDGSVGMTSRRCTSDFKVDPIHKAVRRLAGVRRGEKSPVVNQLLGISRDEVVRMKPSREPWKIHSFPLVDADMTRQGCKDWMQARGYPEPPRSACVFCPYHSDDEWARLKSRDPAGFARAVNFERRLNEIPKDIVNGIIGRQTLHRSGKPIDEVSFGGDPRQGNLWGNECEGMCGV